MLKKETLNLLNPNSPDFIDIFSICIGKSFLFQSRFIDYLGQYNHWDTDVEKGLLKLDNRLFNVEYIGTTSTSDNYWYSADLEKIIPIKYVNLIIDIKKVLKSLGLNQLAEGKIMLNNDLNGYNLSMIYLAFAPQNVTYFCGSGNTSIYMFVKNLPDTLFKEMNSIEFSNRVMEIISTFNVNHRLMVKALLIENNIQFNESQNEIIAKFNEKSVLTIKFNEKGLVNISGNLSL